jgi:hypothetical protein
MVFANEIRFFANKAVFFTNELNFFTNEHVKKRILTFHRMNKAVSVCSEC